VEKEGNLLKRMDDVRVGEEEYVGSSRALAFFVWFTWQVTGQNRRTVNDQSHEYD
jgi:hypothetical protein